RRDAARDAFAQLGGHRDAVSAVPAGVVDAVEHAGMRHLVARERDGAAPRIVDANARELREYARHAGSKRRRRAPRGVLVRLAELGASAEQQPAIGGDPKVKQKMLR